MSTEAIRKITIEATSKGVTEATDKLRGLDAAQKGVASSGTATATVTDIQSKRSLSAAEAYRRQTLAVVDGARQQDQLARATRVVDSALKQGIITTDQHAARVHLLNQKYGEASVGTRGMAAATSFLRQAMAPLMAMLSVGAVIGFARSVFDSTKELGEQAQQLGVGVEALQAYRAAFVVNGISMDEGNTIIQRLSKNIGAAKESAGTAREVFAALGLGLEDLSTTEGGIQRVAQALLGIEDANKRAYLETQIFGKGGQKVETVLREMAASTDEMIQKGKDLGLVLSSDMAESADKAADRFEIAVNRMKTTWAPFVTSLATGAANLGEAFNAQTWTKRLPAELEYSFGGLYGKGHLQYFNKSDEKLEVQTIMERNARASRLAGGSALKPYALSGASMMKDLAAFNAPTSKGWDPAAEQRVLASAQEEARLARLTATERAAENEVILRAGELQTINGAKSSEISKTYAASAAYLTEHLGKQGLQQYRNLGIQKEQATAGEKIKVTFDGYLASLGEEARLAGLTTEQRTADLAVIKGAQIYQKQNGVLEKDLVKTRDTAAVALGGQRVTMIEQEQVQIRINALAARFSEQAHSALKDYQDAVAAINQNVTSGAYSSAEGVVQKAALPLNQDRLGLMGQLGQENPLGAGGALAGVSVAEQAANEQRARQLQNDKFLKAGIETEQRHADMQVAINQSAAQRIANAESQYYNQRLTAAAGYFGQIAELSNSSNSTLSAIGKAAAIAQATINGFVAVSEALASGPPPWNFIAAGVVAAAAAVNVAKISGVAGFEQGGYTGDMGTSQVAGVVHGREYVFDAASTQNIGIKNLDAIRRGDFGGAVANNNSLSIVLSAPITVNAQGAQKGVAEEVSDKLEEIIPRLEKTLTKLVDARSPGNAATARTHPRRR